MLGKRIGGVGPSLKSLPTACVTDTGGSCDRCSESGSSWPATINTSSFCWEGRMLSFVSYFLNFVIVFVF